MDARDQLLHPERLGDVIICAEFEAENFVGFVKFGGQQDDGRLALFAVAVPGVVLALLVLLIRMRKQATASVDETGGGLLAYVRAHLRTFLGVFLGFGLAAAASGTVASWIAVVLVRDFGETPASTGVHFGLVMVLASVAGVAASAWLVRHLLSLIHI